MIYFTRLTYNDNLWELPSPHRWKLEYRHRKGYAFENQYGYGHEEWLLNPRYRIDGYQYGYIRGLDTAGVIEESIDEIHLFTLTEDKPHKLVYYLGYISNVQVIKNNNRELKKIDRIIKKYQPDMVNEILSINGDPTILKSWPHRVVVKFKIENIHFLPEPQIQPDFKKEKYHRYLLYSAEDINKIFNIDEEDADTFFNPGKAKQTGGYTRKKSESSVTIQKLHSEIVDVLENYLSEQYSIKKQNISIEKTRFKGKIADLVTKSNSDVLDIYEIKTTYSGRMAMREALAQLLDYALNTSRYKINRLIIVAPATLNNKEQQLLKRYKDIVKFNVEYLHYSESYESKFKML